MNNKVKSTLILVTTLVIGMILGSVLTLALTKNRIYNRLADLRTEPGFVRHLERMIDPDAGQREKVHEILIDHFERMHRVGREMRMQFKVMNDSLFQDLEKVLRPEQIEQLKDRMERMKRFSRPPGPPRHRPRDRDKIN